MRFGLRASPTSVQLDAQSGSSLLLLSPLTSSHQAVLLFVRIASDVNCHAIAVGSAFDFSSSVIHVGRRIATILYAASPRRNATIVTAPEPVGPWLPPRSHTREASCPIQNATW